jgi:hypothetical protein
VPAGELVDGSTVHQAVESTRLPSLRPGSNERLCAEVLMATYLRRENSGSLTYTLTDGSTAFAATVDSSTVQDNTWTAACFDEAAAGLLESRQGLTLIVSGQDGQPGRSVTAWLRPAVEGEPAAALAGTAAGPDRDDLVLRYRFALESPPLHGRIVPAIGRAAIGAAGLGLIVAGLLAVPSVGAWARGRRSPSTDAPLVAGPR